MRILSLFLNFPFYNNTYLDQMSAKTMFKVCSEDCDHTDHGLTLREGDMAQHVLTTGHR